MKCLKTYWEIQYLEKFYKDQERYAFPLELSFLVDRYNQLLNELSSLDLKNDFADD